MSFYLGQIELFGFNFAPAGWAPCNGQIMSIAQNQALFSLIGVNYGGNGVTDFALPSLHPVTPSGPHYFIFINAKAATMPARH
jgi:microcystin-dependent protein